MLQLERLWSWAVELTRSNRGLVPIASATIVLLVLPDLIFHWAGYQTASVNKQESMLLAVLLGLSVTLIQSRRLRLATVGLLLASQALWFGCLAYFGRPLGPEQLLLATNEAVDITVGIIDGWRVLMPPLLTVAATGLLLVLLQLRPIPAETLRNQVGGYVFALVMLGCAAYWLSHRRVVVTIPGARTFSAIGPYQSLVSATRLLLTPVAASPGMRLADPVVVPAAIEEEPVTVVVIMGEGITPTRLSLFGFNRETTPRLDAWRSSPPPGFEMIGKIGFTGGVATFGSVPALLKMSYWPVEGEWRGVNLFDLAHESGFKSWFLSAQSRHFLDVAGGARGAERVVTDQDIVDKLAERHDDILVDLAREIPAEPKRRFVFLHQRVNHSNYTSHCSHLAAEEQRKLYIFELAAHSTQDRRRAAYDNGLRCWDRNVTDLAQTFLNSAGAVYIFITADHSEMMGESGMWGHSQPELRVALAPVLLLTNRPKSDIATRLRVLSPPNWYQLSQLVARALGRDVSTPGAQEGRFYLNTTMPFGRSGYFEVERAGEALFKVRRFSREGQLQSNTSIELPELGTANAAVAATQGSTENRHAR